MEIIQNFLPKDQFNKIKDILTDIRFPYYYQNSMLDDRVEKYKDSDFYFCHILYDEINKKQNSENVIIKQVLMPILEKLKATKILRAKINLYTKTGKQVHSAYHIDQNDENVKVAIYSLNTNNGYTKMKTGEIGKSIENSLIMFNANEYHKAVTQTDTKTRINININYS